MIRILAAACTALLLIGATALAQTAPAHPKLKPAVTVTGSLVRIGDLVENAGAVADVAIFRSPDLGTTGTVSTQAVVEAVRAHALKGLDTGGLNEVSVTRASRTFKPEDIENAIANALAAKFSLGSAKDISLNLDDDLRPLRMEPSAKGEPRVERISYDTRSGRFAARLSIPSGPASRFALRLSGRATATLEVATVVAPIARGATLKDADIVMERHPRRQLGRDVITNRDKAVGMAARTALQPGQPLRTAQLMKPLVVLRNEQVTLVYRIPGIMLTVRGKATEAGAVGDVISVLNEQSKRIIQGEVVGPGHVVVNTQARKLAANLAAAHAPNVSNR
jgi:flagellar basal body P-ring formation protein FlgA